MKLETFFEKFDQFADAPDAVAKMRELVLELAVQGKLVAPSPKPDKHPAWLAFRKELSERIYSYDPGPPPPFEIPDHWVWCVVGEVAKPCGQKTPDEKFTYIDVGSIDNARGTLKPELNIFEAAEAPSRARKLAQPGSVIYATVRPYLKNIAVIEKDFSPPAIISTAFAILHPLPFVESQFLFYWLRSSSFEREVSAYAKGVAYPAISDGDLKRCAVPVPPPAEQKRIVAKVDELMALCDRLEAQQQEWETRHAALARASLARFADAPTPANLDFLFHPSYAIPPADLRKSILTLAVQGKLVPQDPNDEPAESSIERVSKDAKKAIRDGIIRRHGLEETPDGSDLSELPFGWRWTRLVEVTRPVQYAIKRGPFGSAIRKDMFVPTGFKVYEQQHAISGDFAKGRYYVNEAKFEELSAFELHPGEILVSCSGTVGKVAIVPANIERGIINQALLKLSLHQSALLNEYFLILFPAFFMETDTLTNLSGTAQKNIPGMDVLKAMPFPLPPLAEQRRIVAKVSDLMALVDALETQLAASRATAANLLSALVAELTTNA